MVLQNGRHSGFPIWRAAAGVKEIINDHPLAVLGQGEDDGYKVLNRETVDGVYVRADVFVYRLELQAIPARIDFYATRYGQPLESAIDCTWPTTGLMGGAGTECQDSRQVHHPQTSKLPTGIIEFNSEFQT